MDYAHKVAELLLQIKAIKLDAKQPFTWASGIRSPIYCDNRIALSYPHVRSIIKKAMIEQCLYLQAFDVIAGVATAGIPHGAVLADALGLPFIYVRSKAKEHGRQNQIEGSLTLGARVLVVEDLISTGGSSIDAIVALRAAGAKISALLSIFTYELDVAQQRMKEAQINQYSITNYTTLIAVAKELRVIEQDELELLASWRQSPNDWNPI
ncbi:MAG: orotate phosphoribosyltransferase [Saprospiraceae bacterium]|nr:orotate phosphoribosyltransferase [Saprospiraceae bacterium]